MRRHPSTQLPAEEVKVHPDTVDEGEETESVFSLALVEHLRIMVGLYSQQPVLDEIARRMTATLREGGKILLCGNGGSAADAQHLAAELVGRFQSERRGMAAIALTTDTSVLTSIANDYGYDQVFRRQVEALASPGDLLVGLSTSGESPNVCSAVAAARIKDVYTVALCGEGGGRLAELADIALRVPSGVTARIQEAHIFCGHVLCASVEAALLHETGIGECCIPVTAPLRSRDIVEPGQAQDPSGLAVVARRHADLPVAASLHLPQLPKNSRGGWQMKDEHTGSPAGERGKWL